MDIPATQQFYLNAIHYTRPRWSRWPMPHAKRSSAGNMHCGRPRNSLRSNSLGRLSAVCIQPALVTAGSRGPGHLPHPGLPQPLPCHFF